MATVIGFGTSAMPKNWVFSGGCKGDFHFSGRWLEFFFSSRNSEIFEFNQSPILGEFGINEEKNILTSP